MAWDGGKKLTLYVGHEKLKQFKARDHLNVTTRVYQYGWPMKRGHFLLPTHCVYHHFLYKLHIQTKFHTM